MPYIDETKRSDYDTEVLCLVAALKTGGHQDGDLNYVISAICHKWILTHPEGLCYGTISDIVKALECAKLEFYAQVALPYEEVKKEENGTVSRLDNPLVALSSKTPR